MEQRSREQYRTTDEEMVAEFGRVLDLFRRALANRTERAAFYRLMNEASAQGMTWVDGLTHVVEQRPQLKERPGSEPQIGLR